MLIKNVDETLVNGTMGKVVRFADPSAPIDDEHGILGAPAPSPCPTPLCRTGAH